MKLSTRGDWRPKDEAAPHARSEFSPMLAKRICAEALDTPSITQIANRVRIPVNTLYKWIKAGNEGDPRYQAFALEFAEARANHEKRWLGNVEDVAELDDPRAANAKLRANEFLLKKHFRKEYGDQVSVHTMVDNRTNFDLKVLSHTQKRVLHTMLKATLADNDGGTDDDVKRLLSDLPTIDVESTNKQAGE
jgi:transposase-like protein